MGHWIIKYEGSPESGGTIGKYTCSECGKSAYATEFPRYFFDEKDKWHDPKFCPNCGSHNSFDFDHIPTMAEVIRDNMSDLLSSYKKYKDDEDIQWWCNENGSDYLDGIDCHIVFQDDPPCLCDERNIDIHPKTVEEQWKRDEACAECKAIWLMGKYE